MRYALSVERSALCVERYAFHGIACCVTHLYVQIIGQQINYVIPLLLRARPISKHRLCTYGTLYF